MTFGPVEIAGLLLLALLVVSWFLTKRQTRFPYVLWILSIFGLPGGIIGALIAKLKYHGTPWWELLITGTLSQVLLIILISTLFPA